MTKNPKIKFGPLTTALVFNSIRPKVITAALLIGCGGISTITSFAQAWDNSVVNPYVLKDADQCTAFAWGRFKVVNGESLQFKNLQNKIVAPDGGLMVDYVIETPTAYRDSVPVRGALVSWKGGAHGHAASIERVNADGSALISEQNWPKGSAPNTKTLTAVKLQRRPSVSANGNVTNYELAGFVNPNRPPAFGAVYPTKFKTTLQVDFALLDEDNRQVKLIYGVLDRGQVVPETAGAIKVNPNRPVRLNLTGTAQLKRGKIYTFQVYAYDFRGLRSSTSKNFNW